MADGEDLYRTIDAPAEAQFKERSSKFFAYAYPVSSPEEAMELVEGLRKRYYDATHHCYAYRLGADGGVYRANDDGEPSGTAGRPILGQMLSAGVTDCLIETRRAGAYQRLSGIGCRGACRSENRGENGGYNIHGRFPVCMYERCDEDRQGGTAPYRFPAFR